MVPAEETDDSGSYTCGYVVANGRADRGSYPRSNGISRADPRSDAGTYGCADAGADAGPDLSAHRGSDAGADGCPHGSTHAGPDCCAYARADCCTHSSADRCTHPGANGLTYAAARRGALAAEPQRQRPLPATPQRHAVHAHGRLPLVPARAVH